MKVKTWSQYITESFDFFGAINNFLKYGYLPGNSELEKYKSAMIQNIMKIVDDFWYEYDVEFLEHGIVISNEGNEIIINIYEGYIKMNKSVLYFPKKDLKELYGKIHQIRQDKMTVSGTHLISNLPKQ
jgi:hypothetical protein